LQQFLKPTKTESLIENARLSKNGKYIFGWMVNHRVFVYNTSSNNINYFKSDGKICHLELSENDSLIALVYRNNKGQICDLNGNKKYSFDVTLNDVNNENLVRFFQSGSYLLAFATGSEVNILDRSGNIAFKLSGHKGRINSLDISPDERFIVTVSDDKRGYIWNFNSTTKSYGIYDSLVSHKNTVWSCHFNNSGNYIITASADSNIKIWNLSGKQINPMFTFFKRTGENSRYRLNNGEKDEDASNPKYSNYYGKFCDAEFTNHESEIIAKGYRIKKDSASKEVPEYYKVIFLGGAGEFPSASGTTFYSSSSGNDTIMSPNFREVIISDDEKLAAFSDEKNNEITLLTGDGRIMSSFKGSQPLFSKDSYELFWVRDQSICRFPVSPAKMKSLLEHYNISNDSKDRLNITIGF